MSEPNPKLANEGALAGSCTLACRHCSGKSFKVLADIRDLRVKIGDSYQVPNAVSRIWCIECTACGDEVFKAAIK